MPKNELEVYETLGAVKRAGDNAKQSRAEALGAARLAIATLQDLVIYALDGTMLMGLPNLGTSSDNYNAINVRARNPKKKIFRGDKTLVLGRDGALTIASVTRDEIELCKAEISMLGVDDAERVFDAYTMALKLHLVFASKSAERSRRVVSLKKIIDKAAEEFRNLTDETCAYCGEAAEGNWSVPADASLSCRLVSLCDGCGNGSEPTLDRIWEMIASRKNYEESKKVESK